MADAVMLHYSVNKPIGALMGESDLTTIIPWLLRYQPHARRPCPLCIGQLELFSTW